MKYIIESDNENLIDIANFIERIDTVMICIPVEMSEKQVSDYFKVQNLLAKAITIIKDADDIAHQLWSD